MKKIGILTFHRALNYGAVLQLYALSESVKEICGKDVSVEVIDYRNEEIEKGRSLKNRLKPISIKNFIRTFLLYQKINKFDTFLNNYINVSKKIYSNINFNELEKDYDLIIVGSDQVWNLKITGNDYNYMLPWDGKKNKYSYAASVGLNSFTEAQKEKIKKLLSKFNYISLRENETKKIFEGELKLNVEDVCIDPTLLLEEKKWNELKSNNKKTNKYILVYNIQKPDQMLGIVSKISREKNMKVYYIPNGIKPKGGKLLFPNINQFIQLFSNAEYVVTNSFHGTVFSIIFKRKMLVELKKGSTRNDRIKTLLKICGLEERIFDGENHSKIYEDIEWKNVENNIKVVRNSSNEYLKKILKEK